MIGRCGRSLSILTLKKNHNIFEVGCVKYSNFWQLNLSAASFKKEYALQFNFLTL